MTVSDVAKFRQRQASQEEAAKLGLEGLASGVSRHTFIETRMQKGAEHILSLIEAGRHEEAQRLMTTRSWGQAGLEEEEDLRCHTTIQFSDYE